MNLILTADHVHRRVVDKFVGGPRQQERIQPVVELIPIQNAVQIAGYIAVCRGDHPVAWEQPPVHGFDGVLTTVEHAPEARFKSHPAQSKFAFRALVNWIDSSALS